MSMWCDANQEPIDKWKHEKGEKRTRRRNWENISSFESYRRKIKQIRLNLKKKKLLTTNKKQKNALFTSTTKKNSRFLLLK